MGEAVAASEHEQDVAGQVAEPAGATLSDEELARRDAALAEVRKFGDPVLKSRARELSSFGAGLEDEAARMIELMQGAMGVGLAATQLGVMHRLLVFQSALDATPTAIANPVIEWLSDEIATIEEGCLSLPGISVDVERPLHARVRAVDLRGEPLLLEASGLEARILQHEIDHLDGVLILDRTAREQRKGALRALREGSSYTPPREDGEQG